VPGLEIPPGLLPHLHRAEPEPGHYLVSGALTAADFAALAQWWDSEGILPVAVSMAPRSLEDVFLDIAGRSIR
jgi:ABC-2 type transport system ATP-binding protein